MKRFILSALFFIALLVIWHLLVLAKVWSPVLLPDPISVWEYLKGAAADGTLLEATLVTMRRLLAGYVIGIAAGLPLGYQEVTDWLYYLIKEWELSAWDRSASL